MGEFCANDVVGARAEGFLVLVGHVVKPRTRSHSPSGPRLLSWFVTVKAVSPRSASVWVSVRLPRVNVVADALEQVEALGGSVVHPGGGMGDLQGL